MKNYLGIGLMSGTSLDGLDICFVKFSLPEIQFEILHAETIPYSEDWKLKLSNAIHLPGEELTRLDFEYGHFLGEAVNEFLRKYKIENTDFIASHGHTVFHNPKAGYTLQIGRGEAILKTTGIRTVYDFRSRDVIFGGQGAPLVPIGDELLFAEHDACLNLGGFSNISFRENGQRIAFDICPVNIVLNRLAEKTGNKFDPNGAMAKSGKIIPEILKKMNAMDFYRQPPPKSLGVEWCLKHIYPLFESADFEIPDLLRTYTEHVVEQISKVLARYAVKDVLITGGGAKNLYLIELLRKNTTAEIKIPNSLIIDFKEALIFALMGMLRIENYVNILASVTGAEQNHSGGIIAE